MQPQITKSYADELLDGVMKAIELEIWDIAECLARTLAHHIIQTGEYPAELSRENIEQMLRVYQDSSNYGPN